MGQKRKGVRPKLNAPYYPYGEKSKAYFDNNSGMMKTVADYTGLSFRDVESLDIFEYWGYHHDAFIWGCQQTESGREYLENAYFYQQDKPDRKGLRAVFG